jgi:hypothetical protein
VSAAYTPAFRDLIKDPAVVEEFDRLAAQLSGALEQIELKAQGLAATNGGPNGATAAERGLDTGETVNTRIDGTDPNFTGIRWRRGPWIIDTGAVLTPPLITGTKNNYSPAGFGSCLMLELSSDIAGRQVTGLDSSNLDGYRIVYVMNVGDFAITLKHANTGSNENNRFAFPDAQDLVLEPNIFIGFVWRATATGVKRWYPSAKPYDASASAVRRQWFAFRAGTGATNAVTGIGCADPNTDGTYASNPIAASSYARYRSGVYAGIRWSGAVSQSVQFQQEPTITWKIRTDTDITSVILWCLTSTAEPTTNNAGGAGFGFRYDSSTDLGWVGVTHDGATQTVSAVLAAVAASTSYILKARVSAGIVYFSVDGAAETSQAATVPAAATELNNWFIRCVSPGGGTRGINISAGMCEYGTDTESIY